MASFFPWFMLRFSVVIVASLLLHGCAQQKGESGASPQTEGDSPALVPAAQGAPSPAPQGVTIASTQDAEEPKAEDGAKADDVAYPPGIQEAIVESANGSNEVSAEKESKKGLKTLEEAVAMEQKGEKENQNEEKEDAFEDDLLSAGSNKEVEEQQPEVIISDVDPPGPKAENKEQEKEDAFEDDLLSAGPNTEVEEQQPEVIISDVDPPGPKAENKEQEKGKEEMQKGSKTNGDSPSRAEQEGEERQLETNGHVKPLGSKVEGEEKENGNHHHSTLLPEILSQEGDEEQQPQTNGENQVVENEEDQNEDVSPAGSKKDAEEGQPETKKDVNEDDVPPYETVTEVEEMNEEEKEEQEKAPGATRKIEIGSQQDNSTRNRCGDADVVLHTITIQGFPGRDIETKGVQTVKPKRFKRSPFNGIYQARCDLVQDQVTYWKVGWDTCGEHAELQPVLYYCASFKVWAVVTKEALDGKDGKGARTGFCPCYARGPVGYDILETSPMMHMEATYNGEDWFTNEHDVKIVSISEKSVEDVGEAECDDSSASEATLLDKRQAQEATESATESDAK